MVCRDLHEVFIERLRFYSRAEAVAVRTYFTCKMTKITLKLMDVRYSKRVGVDETGL